MKIDDTYKAHTPLALQTRVAYLEQVMDLMRIRYLNLQRDTYRVLQKKQHTECRLRWWLAGSVLANLALVAGFIIRAW